MKRCELCNSPARMHCESDKASLCWYCDSKVHGANFLVARHCRSLLCHVCQCPTPWSASGTEFGPTVSVCRRCVREGAEKIGTGAACEESEGGNEADIDSEDKLSMNKDEEEVADSDEADDDRDGDLQVVPWSSTASPPPATSSSTDEEYSSRKLPVESDGDSPITSLKRSREISSDLRLQEDLEPWNKRREYDDVIIFPVAAGELVLFQNGVDRLGRLDCGMNSEGNFIQPSLISSSFGG